MHFLLLVGARPNFMKMAPVLAALKARGARTTLVHTGQHYDAKMSDVFFDELGLPAPDVHLNVGSGTHAEQTAKVMLALEPVLVRERPDVLVVAGDVNSTLAGALVAAKLLIPIAHVEAGLRSFDWAMPEEVNRVVVDRLSALLFTPSRDGDDNLRKEGAAEERIVFVGNAMIDSLLTHLPRARARDVHARLQLEPKKYALATLHRPSNVDSPEALLRVLTALSEVAAQLTVLLPVHPRTQARITQDPQAAALLARTPALRLCEPLGYLDFLALTDGARLVMTDSGGIQEETTALGVPCLTLRENTERPITVDVGTNQLTGSDPARVVPAARAILAGQVKASRIPELWDGHAGERMADALVRFVKARA
ncbi:MAG: UDP-N-acetylglucosamine 2-epimerase (non-hydrolyzing) [Deltaproteobacteria bacterium]|nr:UDP-N-acetylglucosamine 2-epimerase (non-hydrolyzing) [Deltaproteobacteria bacterium]